MLTVGNLLKKARENAGKTLEDVSHATKIKVAYLKNIEDNQFDGVATSTHVKGFIRNYASFLNLDSESLVAIYRRQIGEEEKPLKRKGKTLNRKAFVITPSVVISGILATFFIVVISYLIIQFYRVQQPPKLALASPKEATVTVNSTPFEITGATESDTLVTVNGTQIQIKPDQTFAYTVELLPGDNIFTIEAWKRAIEEKKSTKVVNVIFDKSAKPTNPTATVTVAPTEGTATIVVQTSDSAWIQVVMDNVQKAVGIKPKGYKTTLSAKKEFYVVSGKPTVTKVLLNGEEKSWKIKNGVGSISCEFTDGSWVCK